MWIAYRKACFPHQCLHMSALSIEGIMSGHQLKIATPPPDILCKYIYAPKVLLKGQIGKIIVPGSSCAGIAVWTVLCSTLWCNCCFFGFQVPAIFAGGKKFLVPTKPAIHIASLMTHLGSVRNVVWRCNKCNFPWIAMRTYYLNFCGHHCIGLNLDPVPPWLDC